MTVERINCTDYANIYGVYDSNCATFESFGCVWALDCYYMPSKEEIKEFELACNVRYRAHVIKSCETYKGLPEMSAGAFSVYDGRQTA